MWALSSPRDHRQHRQFLATDASSRDGRRQPLNSGELKQNVTTRRDTEQDPSTTRSSLPLLSTPSFPSPLSSPMITSPTISDDALTKEEGVEIYIPRTRLWIPFEHKIFSNPRSPTSYISIWRVSTPATLFILHRASSLTKSGSKPVHRSKPVHHSVFFFMSLSPSTLLHGDPTLSLCRLLTLTTSKHRRKPGEIEVPSQQLHHRGHCQLQRNGDVEARLPIRHRLVSPFHRRHALNREEPPGSVSPQYTTRVPFLLDVNNERDKGGKEDHIGSVLFWVWT